MPCVLANKSELKCDLYSEPTEEDIRLAIEKQDAAIRKIESINPLIEKLKKTHKKGDSGMVECPICEGRLSYLISPYNGHSRGKCETESCVFWME